MSTLRKGIHNKMRKLKFRCFDVEKKIMVEDCSHIQRDGLEVMQFTGLLDKSGQEIYEGDIVEIPYQTDDIECIQRVVFWDDARACFSTAHEEDDYDDLMDKGIKVIGNIYENPELLEKP